jgi:hypothetical protein
MVLDGQWGNRMVRRTDRANPPRMTAPTGDNWSIARHASHNRHRLHLPARENYDRLAAHKSPKHVALITGEEMIVPPEASWFSRTVEAMPLGHDVEFKGIGPDIIADAVSPSPAPQP